MPAIDLTPAIGDLVKLGPVVTVLLVVIWHQSKSIRKKDAKIDKLHEGLLAISGKQTEATTLVSERLQDIESALRLRKRLARQARPEEG